MSCVFHVWEGDEATPRHYCQPCYEGWRDGEREGPAMVIDMTDTCAEPCQTCPVEESAAPVKKRRR